MSGRWMRRFGRQSMDGVRSAQRLLRAGRSARWLRWFRYALYGAALLFVGAAFPSHIRPLYLSLVGADTDIREFEEAHERASSALMYDGAGRYVGILSAAAARDQDYVTRLRGKVVLGAEVFFNDHKSVPVEDAPRYFYACLAYLEDRYRGRIDNPYGVSYSGVLRIPMALAGFGRGGGSTLEMQLARSMWQSYPGEERRNNTTREERKLNEWEAAPRLRRVLTKNFTDERAFRRWTAQHIALARGADFQGSVYGVEAGGMFVFGKRAADLSPAEQLVLAAAVKQPLRFRQSRARRKAALRRLIGTLDKPQRAVLCALPEARYAAPGGERPVFSDDKIRQAALAELSVMADGYQGPYLHPDLAPLAEDLTRFAAGPRYGPLRLSADFLGLAASEASAQLEDYFGSRDGVDPKQHLFRGRLSAMRLTLDVVRNTPFKREAKQLLTRWGERMTGAFGPRFSADVLDFLLIVAIDEQGRVVRYFNSSDDRPLFGRAATRPESAYGEGAYDPRRETRTMGSVYKVAAALLLAEAGETDPRQAWSNTCFPGITRRCMDVSTGRGDQPSVSAREAFAESLNAAVARRVDTKVDRKRLREFAASLGVAVADPLVRDATNVALGNYRARPLEVLMLMSMARAYAEADWNAPIARPHLVSEIEAFDKKAGKAEGWRRIVAPADALSSYLSAGADPKRSAAFVREALSAPLCMRTTRLVRPTLRGLRRWCAAKNGKVALHLAKTGTVAGFGALGLNEKDWWIGGAIRFTDGRAYSYVVALGPAPSKGAFARNLSARQLGPFVDLLLNSLQSDG